MKKNTIFKAILLVFLTSAFASCTKDMPKSLSEILKKNEVDGYQNGSSGGGGNAKPGGGAPSAYQGQNSNYVNQLLSKVSGWKTASCTTCNDGFPPMVDYNVNCQRDVYVQAAVGYAWAAESYYRLGETAKASSAIDLMMQNLQLARALCGPATINGGGSCITLDIFPC